MKVSFPLSLKISLWLLLNLLLLGAAAIGLIVAQGGAGIDALVRGPAGQRLQQLASAIAGEYAVAEPAARDAVLARFGAAYDAEFFLLHHELSRAAPPPLPPDVLARSYEQLPPIRLLHRPNDTLMPPFEEAGPPLLAKRTVISFDPGRSRFLLRSGEPRAFWLGTHVRLGARLPPAVLVARVDSWWNVLQLLDLQSWLLAAAGVLGFSVLFWLPLVHGITRDLRLLTAATEGIAEGKFATRVAATRRDELGRLGESVNTMAARLDLLVNGQKRFLGDVAHELGSPLARLQFATEILEQQAGATLHTQISDVRDEVQHMSALVNELLAFTKAGLRPRDAALADVDLRDVIGDVLAREDPTGRVQPELSPFVVRADRELLGRALSNLVRNAIRYAGDHGPIRLSACRDAGRVRVVLEDEGPGVPAEALARLGEPFYRPESARSRESGGVGLGLAIVRSSVAACGGEVHFANRAPRGFRVEVLLAIAERAANSQPEAAGTFTRA
jgi:two-component system, OmpR family, sensor histidine kinase CpxA